ncbi:MAG: methyltransferase, partial [candidate division Zixibacteria bacterium]|nr:methyltransferase [candidate division Zixibacteria bacterium]NIT72393.1 methyltransferase [candidate division KSB1 bacterium]NIW46337.1 methyltransferase [Gammaproteobacteria bacterium]NIR65275.1 methyltransferase [candidate division Zixibacteria bacterium]NIS47013.1 methyltransferase [candidate division Zixibacteria bacterium]
HVQAEPAIQGQPGHNSLLFIIKAMMPRVIEHGVASEEEIDIDTLEERLAAECADGAIYIIDMAFGVWGHKL